MNNLQKLDELPGHNDTRQQGRLTLDKWIVWAKEGGLSLAELYTPADFDRTFNLVSQSEFLRKNFFQLPQLTQNRIGNYIDADEEFFPDYAASLDMLSRMSQTHNRPLNYIDGPSHNWFSAPTIDSTKEARKYITDRVQFAIATFVQHQSDLCPYFSIRIFHLTDLVTNCLAVLHGTKHMSEVMEHWKTLTEYRSLLDFVALADNWENVKEYPIGWALELSTTSLV